MLQLQIIEPSAILSVLHQSILSSSSQQTLPALTPLAAHPTTIDPLLKIVHLRLRCLDHGGRPQLLLLEILISLPHLPNPRFLGRRGLVGIRVAVLRRVGGLVLVADADGDSLRPVPLIAPITVIPFLFKLCA